MTYSWTPTNVRQTGRLRRPRHDACASPMDAEPPACRNGASEQPRDRTEYAERNGNPNTYSGQPHDAYRRALHRNSVKKAPTKQHGRAANDCRSRSQATSRARPSDGHRRDAYRGHTATRADVERDAAPKVRRAETRPTRQQQERRRAQRCTSSSRPSRDEDRPCRTGRSAAQRDAQRDRRQAVERGRHYEPAGAATTRRDAIERDLTRERRWCGCTEPSCRPDSNLHRRGPIDDTKLTAKTAVRDIEQLLVDTETPRGSPSRIKHPISRIRINTTAQRERQHRRRHIAVQREQRTMASERHRIDNRPPTRSRRVPDQPVHVQRRRPRKDRERKRTKPSSGRQHGRAETNNAQQGTERVTTPTRWASSKDDPSASWKRTGTPAYRATRCQKAQPERVRRHHGQRGRLRVERNDHRRVKR